MVIKFKHLVIEGFQSIGYAEIDLCDRGFTIINGVNNCPSDNALSNGSGKTSLFNSICYALTGETIQGISRNIVNQNTDTGLYVCLSFDLDGTSFEIIRTKDHIKFGTSLSITVNGENKSGKGIRDTEKIIQEYLPDLNSELLGSVIIIGQGMPQRFTSNTPSGRKEVLEKLSKSDFMINDLKDKLSARKNSLGEALSKVNQYLSKLQGKLSIYESQQNRLSSQLATLEMPNEEQIKTCESNINELTAQLNSTVIDENNLHLDIASLVQRQSELKDAQIADIDEVEKKYASSIDNLTAEKYRLNAEISTITTEIRKAESIVDVCPTCGQKLPNVHKIDTTDKKTKLLDLQNLFTDITSQINEVISNRNSEKSQTLTKYNELINDLATQCESKKRALNDIIINKEGLNDKLHKLELQLTTLKSAQLSFAQKKSDIESQLKQTEEEMSKINQEIVYNNVERDETLKRLDVVGKMITIATRDFRGFLLTNIVDYIDRQAKMYSADIFGTNLINLYLDGNNLNVVYNNKMYENLSGGEQKKVDLITQLSIRDMLCQFLSFSSNILVLDETFESLDTLGCQKIIDVITKRLSDIESIFIITHRVDLSLPADSTITVVKDESGVSHLL